MLNPINPQSLQEVTIADTETQQKIYRLLVYRRTARGRTLQAAFPTLGLPRGSRLEPSAALPDVGLFESLETPFTCKFYIGGERGRVLHDSPFLRIPGVTLDHGILIFFTRGILGHCLPTSLSLWESY